MKRARRGTTIAALAGYALLAVSFLIWGSIGVFVRYSTMPESALDRLPHGRRRDDRRRALRAPGHAGRGAPPRRLAEHPAHGRSQRGSILMLFFVALRLTDVAIGMFLLFTGPVYVALLAPRFMHQRPDRIVYPALAVALAGMATILLPGILGAERVSATGIACGVLSGVLFAGYHAGDQDGSRARSRSTTIALGEMVVDTVLLLPLALWQVVGTGYQFTRNDLVAGLALGVLCTAIPYVLYAEGLRRMRVEHASILGYLEPVSAPFYALLLLGEAPATATVAGGALIVVAGVLVVIFGAPEARRRSWCTGRRGSVRAVPPRATRSSPASFAIMGLIGTLVAWATAPESALLVLRFVVAGVVLGAVFARRHPLAGARDRAVWPRLLSWARSTPRRCCSSSSPCARTASRSGCSCSSSPRSGWRSSRRGSSSRRPTASSTRRSSSRSRASSSSSARRCSASAAASRGGGCAPGCSPASATPSSSSRSRI